MDALLKKVLQHKASDLHMTQGMPISLRVDGDILKIDNEIVDAQKMKKLIDPIIPPANRREFMESNDTDFAYEIKGVARFRVNLFRDINGVGAVFRAIPSTIMPASQLGFPSAINVFCKAYKGLVLVTGPTGSGKSTTLASMIDQINESRSQHIITIEDPVEFIHPQKKCLIRQRQIHGHTKSFAAALRAALREDPDIVMIGEMRDLETISIALETAETGHLVFGTLHTNDAISTVNRIVDQFPSNQQDQIRVMLSDALVGIVAQTLLKKKGGGRIAAHEVLVVNQAVKNIIREGKTSMLQNHMLTRKQDGNILLSESLIALVTKGIVEPIRAVEKAIDKKEFVDLLAKMGIQVS
ncbi:MAG: PilT/PilU family type 4a pilus ATPase [Oligoflexales bacterium]|nr:PilT/PilU family type 4a pilus ATPase [Oligoflexales bacterium]